MKSCSSSASLNQLAAYDCRPSVACESADSATGCRETPTRNLPVLSLAERRLGVAEHALVSIDKHEMDQLLGAVKTAAAIAAAIYVFIQVRKPSKWGGRLFLWVMNLTHSRLTDWGLRHIQIEDHFTVLDVGCGGGRTIHKLAGLAKVGIVYGVDYAEGSVAASRATNAQLIRAGRVEIKQGSVSQLLFSEEQFNLVSAVETQYYWPNLVDDMKEILRTLKPRGNPHHHRRTLRRWRD